MRDSPDGKKAAGNRSAGKRASILVKSHRDRRRNQDASLGVLTEKASLHFGENLEIIKGNSYSH